MELKKDRCGTRSRYNCGCRCVLCRRAHADYEARLRAGKPRTVCAEEVREHILALGRAGIGSRSIAAAAGVERSVVRKIAQGQKEIFRSTADRILGVDEGARADSSCISSAEAQRLIRQLVNRGFTKNQIAVWLGYARMLQLNKAKITALNAVRVQRLVALLDEGRIARGGPGIGRSRRGTS